MSAIARRSDILSNFGFLELDPTSGRTVTVPAVSRPGKSSRGACNARFSVVGFFRRLFVPTGKVSLEYGRFQLADSIQATCSYLRGILSVHATLTGAGLGAAAAAAAAATGADGASLSTVGAAAIAALAAVITLVLKDGCGMIGSLLFSYLFSHRFDSELRFWRLFADLINDIGLTIELLAPLAGPQLFVPVTCTANVCKALCGVAAGATRVSLAKHFALDGASVAEVQAKEGAQETAVTLLGLCLGLMCSNYLNSSLTVQWTAFTALTLLHVASNYYAVRILRLRTLNRTRIAMLASLAAHGSKSPCPATVADLEPVLPVQYARRFADTFCCGSQATSSVLCCSPRRSHGRSGGKGAELASNASPRLTAPLAPPSLLRWLNVWECEPCSIALGVSANELIQTAKQAAADDAAISGTPLSEGAIPSCIARVPLPIDAVAATATSTAAAPAPSDGSNDDDCAFVAVLRSKSPSGATEGSKIVIALPPSATAATIAAVYLGALAWSDPVYALAGVECEISRKNASRLGSGKVSGKSKGHAEAQPGSNAAAALALARLIAATVKAAPGFFTSLAAAGWDVGVAGGFSIAESGLRLSLQVLRDGGGSADAAAEEPAQAAAAVPSLSESSDSVPNATGAPNTSASAGSAGPRRRRKSVSA